ncbi:MAG: APC family permease [Gemmatimonadales bacterium]
MTELKKTLGGIQYFSLGFGAIVGVGWIVYLGLWFDQAGPVGTMVAFVLGGLLMAIIGLCYAELATMYEVAGAEAAYGYAAFGPGVSFAVGWAMVLMLVAVIPYVSVSLGWILDVLVPGIGGPTLYSWRGQPIRAGSLAVAVGWTLWLGVLNYRGIRPATRFQDWLTYGKIAISVLFFAAGIFGGSTANLAPAFGRGASGLNLNGLLAVLATTPWFLAGFNQVPQSLEEKAPGLQSRTVGLLVVLAIVSGGVYYGLAAISAGMAGPWTEISGQELPAAAAFRAAFGSELFARLVLVAGLFGIVTVGNACTIAVTRLLFSLGRSRAIAPAFTRLHPRFRSPVTAIVFAVAFGVIGNFLGRAGIAPIVNVGSAAACLGYLVAALAVIRLRQIAPDRHRGYRVPGGVVTAWVAALGGAFLLVSSLRQHWLDAKGGIPLEWIVIAVWAALGAVLYRQSAPARAELGPERLRKLMLEGEAAS